MDQAEMMELLQELMDTAEQPEEDGFITVREIAFKQDRDDILHSQRRRLARLVEQGKVEMRMVTRVAIDGRRYSCPGYRVVEGDSL